MLGIYRLSLLGTRLIYKIRHHKGHGIHSPFVFSLINNVIEEKLPYYCYKDLPQYVTEYGDKEQTIKKENLLAFRLVNYFGAKKILEIGAGNGINTLCLTTPSSKIDCLAIEANKQKFDSATKLYQNFGRNIVLRTSIVDIPDEQYDCICIDLDQYQSLTIEDLDKLTNMCHEKSFILVKGIRTNKKQNKLWKRLSQNETRTAELDLFEIGLLFFDKQLYRWRYQISF